MAWGYARGFTVVAYEQRKLRKNLRYEFISITMGRNTKKTVQVAFDDLNKVAYVNKNIYSGGYRKGAPPYSVRNLQNR